MFKKAHEIWFAIGFFVLLKAMYVIQHGWISFFEIFNAFSVLLIFFIAFQNKIKVESKMGFEKMLAQCQENLSTLLVIDNLFPDFYQHSVKQLEIIAKNSKLSSRNVCNSAYFCSIGYIYSTALIDFTKNQDYAWFLVVGGLSIVFGLLMTHISINNIELKGENSILEFATITGKISSTILGQLVEKAKRDGVQIDDVITQISTIVKRPLNTRECMDIHDVYNKI